MKLIHDHDIQPTKSNLHSKKTLHLAHQNASAPKELSRQSSHVHRDRKSQKLAGTKRLKVTAERALNSDNIERTKTLIKASLGAKRRRTKTDDGLTDSLAGDMQSSKSQLYSAVTDSQPRSPERPMVAFDNRGEGKRKIKKTPKMENFKIQIDHKPQKKAQLKQKMIPSHSQHGMESLQLTREESITKDKELFIHVLQRQRQQNIAQRQHSQDRSVPNSQSFQWRENGHAGVESP